MARSASPPALAEICNPSSVASQIVALKQLRNELVGHDQRKEHAVRHGVVAPLVRILASASSLSSPSSLQSKASGKRRSSGGGNGIREVNGSAGGVGGGGPVGAVGQSGAWTEEDEVRLQATLIVGSLAHGGRAIVIPLLAGSVLPPLLSALNSSEVPPRLLAATLSALLVITEAAGRRYFTNSDVADSPSVDSLADQFFSPSVVECFAEILCQRAPTSAVFEQVTLTAQLVSLVCLEEQHRIALLRAGVLNHLVSRFAAMLNAMGYSLPSSDPSVIAGLPPPLPRASLSPLLEAIGAIIKQSDYRTARFLYSPTIIGLFPLSKHNIPESFLNFADGNSVQQIPGQPGGMSWLLPQIQAVQPKGDLSHSKAFPALGSLSSNIARLASLADIHSQSLNRPVSDDDFETPLFAVLANLARTAQGVDRLVAAWLLTLISFAGDRRQQMRGRSDFSDKNRDRVLALLIVPLIVSMIDESNSSDQRMPSSTANPQLVEQNRLVKERAPTVLAFLIRESATLQKAAVDAGAIKKLCQLLKKTFDTPSPSARPLWSPDPNHSLRSDGMLDRSSTLGKPGLSPEIVHTMRCRMGALRAVAAIAHSEDAYRKVLIENGVIACIIDSLIPYPDNVKGVTGGPRSSSNGSSSDVKAGNPIPVLIAACQAARAMSRSVSILRTSLIDAGVSKPVFHLLKYPELDVQIAATDVICNLLLEFSPMREDLIEAGAVKTLCEHAHSPNSRIRLISLWALKHLVLSAPNDIKISCLQELGAEWLLQTVNGDSRESTNSVRAHSQSSTPIGMGTPNAAGEQVDILNAVEVPSMDIDEDNPEDSEDEDEDMMTDSIGSLRTSHITRHAAPFLKARLRAIKEVEQNPVLRAQRDDIQIQEQALDYIRNLITGTGAFEMIDHLFGAFGTSRLFDLLASKLSPKVTLPPGHQLLPRSRTISTADLSKPQQTPSSASPSSSSLSSSQPTEILLAAIFILVHIAAGTPRHRSLLIAQSNLLRSLLPLFSHPERRVRVACVWLVNNLTWVDDQGDANAARSRALELRYLGFDDRLRAAAQDPDLDVRERAKTALEQSGKLLDGGSGGGPTGASAALGRAGGAHVSHVGGHPAAGAHALAHGHAHAHPHGHGHSHGHGHAHTSSVGGSSGGGNASASVGGNSGAGGGGSSRFARG